MPAEAVTGFKTVICEATEPGDVLFKYGTANMVSQAIMFFTRSPFSHAALVADSRHEVIEANGKGVGRNDLLTTNFHFEYEVFRCRNAALAAGAANAADMIVAINTAKNGRAAKYNYAGLAQFPFRLLNKSTADIRPDAGFEEGLAEMLNGGGSRFFCSQLVVYCYHWAARQSGLNPIDVINTGDRVTSPDKLYTTLSSSRHFEHVGRMRREMR